MIRERLARGGEWSGRHDRRIGHGYQHGRGVDVRIGIGQAAVGRRTVAIVAASRGCAVTDAVTVWPTANEPSENVMKLPDRVNVPCPFVAEMYFQLAPKASIRTTLVAFVGPLFVTVRL